MDPYLMLAATPAAKLSMKGLAALLQGTIARVRSRRAKALISNAVKLCFEPRPDRHRIRTMIEAARKAMLRPTPELLRAEEMLEQLEADAHERTAKARGRGPGWRAFKSRTGKGIRSVNRPTRHAPKKAAKRVAKKKARRPKAK